VRSFRCSINLNMVYLIPLPFKMYIFPTFIYLIGTYLIVGNAFCAILREVCLETISKCSKEKSGGKEKLIGKKLPLIRCIQVSLIKIKGNVSEKANISVRLFLRRSSVVEETRRMKP